MNSLIAEAEFFDLDNVSDLLLLNQHNWHFYLSSSKFSRILRPTQDSGDLHWVEGTSVKGLIA